MAILCRTHEQSQQIIEYLNLIGIPNRSPKRNLFNISSVKDLISWVQLLAKGQYYDIALFRILKNEWGYKKAHDFFSIENSFNKDDLIKKITEYGLKNNVASTERITTIIDHFENIMHKRSAAEVVWELCEKLELLKNKARRYLVQDQIDILNISSIISNAQKFSSTIIDKKKDNIFRFNKFIENIMTSGGLPPLEPEKDQDYAAVTIILFME